MNCTAIPRTLSTPRAGRLERIGRRPATGTGIEPQPDIYDAAVVDAADAVEEELTDEEPATPRPFVVCGDNPLALRLVEELVDRYRADVSVVVSGASESGGGHARRRTLDGMLLELAAESVELERFELALIKDLANASGEASPILRRLEQLLQLLARRGKSRGATFRLGSRALRWDTFG